MTRLCVLAAVLAIGCTDARPTPPAAGTTTPALTAASTAPVAKPPFKEPDPEIR